MKTGGLLFALIVSCCAISQSNLTDTSRWSMEISGVDTFYVRKPTPADLARKAGDLNLAITEFRRQFMADSADTDNTYNMACAYALKQMNDSAFYFLNKVVLQEKSPRPLTDADFYFLLEDPRWEDLENLQIKQIEATRGLYKNKALVCELWRMKIKDQAFYYHLEIAEKMGGKNNPAIRAIWELKRLINQENLVRIEEIIAQYGWPTISDVGKSAAGAVFLIIQHAELETQKKYLPLMEAAANKNEADWSNLALLIDRILIGEGKKQRYGSQIGSNPDGSYFVMDVEEPEYLNQRRSAVGLSTIQEYIQYWNIEWKIEQQLK